ncbi:MAG: hypothetical protein IJ230_06785 [Clostridia bacterium]|nr:hypothetical protein [Clostridia bacterium]
MKKLNKFFAILVALAMMATLCVMSAFAAEDEVPTGTDQTAQLVKYLQAGEGVDRPDATFNFTLTALEGNPASIDTVNVAIPASSMTKDANGDYIGSKTIAEIFNGVTFPKAGEYKFTADEVAPTFTQGANDELICDDDTFEVHVYVKNTDDGTAIDKVSVSDGTDKIDPTEKKDTADEGQDNDGKNIGFSFTNTYKKNLVTDDDDDNGVLNVKKNVTGDYADKTYQFDFDLAYTLPAANAGTVKYRIDRGETKGTVQTATASPIDAQLANGDKLVIVAMPQGTTWNVTENLASATVQNKDSYLASSDKYMPATAPTKGQDLATTNQILSAADAVVVTNALDNTDVTPTGILINNLPYIVLALVAVGGMVAYVVSRRKEEE